MEYPNMKNVLDDNSKNYPKFPTFQRFSTLV